MHTVAEISSEHFTKVLCLILDAGWRLYCCVLQQCTVFDRILLFVHLIEYAGIKTLQVVALRGSVDRQTDSSHNNM